MKLTNGEVFRTREPLQELMGEKLPVKTSYELAKLARKLNDQLTVIEDVRRGLVNKYATEGNGKRGKSVDPEGDNYPKFMEEFGILMSENVEIDIDPKQKIKLPLMVAATCDKCSHNMDKPLEIKPSVLMALDSFVEV